jgi:hypothetical protein
VRQAEPHLLDILALVYHVKRPLLWQLTLRLLIQA